MANLKNNIVKNSCSISGSLTINGNSILNKIYPVGSVYITSTNTNPSTTLGGTWSLINKEFKDLRHVSDSSPYFTANSTNVSALNCGVSRTGNTIRFRIYFTNAVQLADSDVEIGTINLTELGCSNTYYAQNQVVGGGDGGAALFLASVTNAGVVTVVETIGKTSGTMASGSGSNAIEYIFNIPRGSMLDSACDKFYWKRTA